MIWKKGKFSSHSESTEAEHLSHAVFIFQVW